jgi:metal-dependent amidase/aminoacylase/carboxypeptidase family protein
MDHAAEGCAQALEGSVKIETEIGYLPFVQDRTLSTFVEKAFAKFDAIPDIITDRGSIAAAGDIGDLSFMMPCIQIGYGGFAGTIHGDDFQLTDPRFLFEIFPEFLAKVFEEMSGHLEGKLGARRTYKEYKELINTIAGGVV